MGYDWLSMEGRLWRMGRKYDPGTLCLGADYLWMEKVKLEERMC